MAVIVSDTFTEATDTSLTAHTPDTGTGWTEEADTGTGNAEIVAADDNLRRDTSETSVHAVYSAQPNPSSGEYDVEFTVSAVYTGSGTRILFVFGRYTNATDAGYAIEIIGGGTTAQKLLKRASGSTTTLDSNTNATNAGDKFKLEIRDATKKVYLDSGAGYVEILTSTDNTITATGKAGVGWGNVYEAGHIVSNWRIDNFIVTEISTGPNVSDSVSVSESVGVSLPDPLAVSVSDSVGVAEAVKAELVHLVNVFEAISLAESTSLDLPGYTFTVGVSDSVSVAEAVNVTSIETKVISVSDSVSVTDSPTIAQGSSLLPLDEAMLTGGLLPLSGGIS